MTLSYTKHLDEGLTMIKDVITLMVFRNGNFEVQIKEPCGSTKRVQYEKPVDFDMFWVIQ